MFKRSFMMVAMVVLLVFASAFTSQMVITQSLPSSLDNGLTIEKAFKTSKVPILIEFYSDDCGTCRKMAPIVHELHEQNFHDKLTVVMLDVTDPGNGEIAKLFGVDSLPALFVFDARHMKKHQIRPEDFVSKASLRQALDQALAKTKTRTGVPSVLAPVARG